MIVYLITNKLNDKVYIGQTKKPLHKRIMQHIAISKSSSDKVIKRRKYIHRAINRYGVENFEWHILKECYSKEELDTCEKKFILEYAATNKRYGYNLTFGKVFQRTISTYNKMVRNASDKTGHNNGMYGKNHTDETKKKMKLKKTDFIPWNKGLKTGLKISNEIKKEISKRMKGNTINKGRTPWNKGIKMSEEDKQKLSEKRKGSIPWNKGTSGLQVAWNKGKKMPFKKRKRK